ncbi:glycerate kinase type-2 family protein [Roseobacteraceae bacterium NS-SX3]
MTSLRDTALRLFQAAVDRADPARALRAQLERAPLPPLAAGGRNLIVAVGKAAVPMMREALSQIPAPREAIAVTNPENLCEVPGARVLAGAHPVPDAASAAAGQAVIGLLSGATAQDRVIALISGGGSALMAAPAPGLALADKAEVNRLLLASGLEISAMNLIRQQLSSLKGGGLLRHAAPAPVTAYILSDVIGDDLRAIASGPTVAPLGSRGGARTLMQEAGIWDAAPQAVRRHLSQDTPEPALPGAQNILIGSNRHSLEAMQQAAAGWDARIVSGSLTGDVAEAAAAVVEAAQQAPEGRPVALIFGGETTVRLTGSGRGGRNQELALRVAQLGAAQLAGDWLFLSAGTDGRDGPTDAAGGIVGPDTWESIRRTGQDPAALLDDNDSYAALQAAGALLITGGTGTNVADVQVFLRRP